MQRIGFPPAICHFFRLVGLDQTGCGIGRSSLFFLVKGDAIQ